MKIPTKFVKPLTTEQRDQLKEIMKSGAPQRKRMRAHAVLLSERHYSIDQIADIYQVDRDRVSQWIDWWEEHDVDGLDDDPRSGRPPKLNEDERQRSIEIGREEPPSTKQGLQRAISGIGKVIWRKIKYEWAPLGVCQDSRKWPKLSSRSSGAWIQNTVLFILSYLSPRLRDHRKHRLKIPHYFYLAAYLLAVARQRKYFDQRPVKEH